MNNRGHPHHLNQNKPSPPRFASQGSSCSSSSSSNGGRVTGDDVDNNYSSSNNHSSLQEGVGSSSESRKLSYTDNYKDRHYQDDDKESNRRSTYQDRKPIKARSLSSSYSNHPQQQQDRERTVYGSRQDYRNASSSSYNNNNRSTNSSYYKRDELGYPSLQHQRYVPSYHHHSSQHYGSSSSSSYNPQGRSRYYHQFNRAPNQFILSYRKKQYEHYEWPDRKENPHCEQILHYNDPCIEEKSFGRMNRILQDDAPQESYRRRKSELKSVIHWGQRKLLMSEIEFLTEFGYPGAIIVYAGAAPGHHTNFLSDLFPDLSFVLVDPSPFVCKPTEKITIVNDFFTDEIAERYADKNVLFISDIRTAQPEKGNENQTKEHRDEIEKCVKWDNQAQMNWHLMIKPKMSMLKFRLPYDTESEKIYEYLKGDVYLPVWGPQTTTETRLVCSKDCGTMVYDTAKYESQMFYFNTRTRVHYYPHQVQVDGMDHCYDCRAEVYILEQYLRKYKKIENESELNRQIAELSNLVSRNCTTSLGSKTHTLATYEKNFRKDEVKKNLASIYETNRIKVDKGENKRSVEEMEELRQKALKSLYKKTKL